MTLEEFRRSILKVDKPRTHKIRGSLGIYDGYKYYRKNGYGSTGYRLTESQYFSITRRVNGLLADNLANGEEVTLPHRMGRLEIRKTAGEIRLDAKGNLVTNLPIDWDRTLKLWYEDEESFNARTLVRVEEKEIFKVYYNRGKANYINKSFYEFSVNRELKKRLKQNIKDRKIEAMYLDKNKQYGK